MKLLHTSDWHLGSAEIERSLHDDQVFFLDRICQIIEEEQIDAVMIAGDVFDRSVASADAIRLYDSAATRICKKLGVLVLMIAGNHDGAERLANCGELLSAAGLHIAGTIEKEPKIVTIKDTEFFLLPWITEEKVKSVYPEERENIDSLADAYRVVADKYRACFTPGKRHILIAHAFITNSETSTSDRAAEIGFATQVPASVFDGFDYVALGHIHKPQDVTGTIRYSGTPMVYSFGKEEKQEKSVTILDTSDLSRKTVSLPLLHRWTTVSGTLAEVLHPDLSEEIRNGYVRIRVTDSYLGLEALSDLKRVYPNLVDASGKTYENENSSITMTVEELEAVENDPLAVFRYFCKEETDIEPDDHLIALFENAMKKATEAEE